MTIKFEGEDCVAGWLYDVTARKEEEARRAEQHEKLKDLTRGQDRITKETIQQFVQTLELSDKDKQRLLDMSPASYVGMAESIVDGLG